MLTAVEAAALPLTAITAWEILFDAFRLEEGGGAGETLLVIGAAGGVGSILVQLAKALSRLTVVATASRPETADWVRQMGADHVIDHRAPLPPQVAALGRPPRWTAILTNSAAHFAAVVSAAAPRGHIAIIEDPGPVSLRLLRDKSLTLTWEFMFTRPTLATEDMIAQHRLLGRIADLVDAGRIRTTLTTRLGPLSAATLAEAHRLQESGRAIGKTVLPVA
jgi:zinc-binding alcohol dehydrogenase family protein